MFVEYNAYKLPTIILFLLNNNEYLFNIRKLKYTGFCYKLPIQGYINDYIRMNEF